MDIFGKIWDIFGKNYGIYLAKTTGYLVGYIRPKVRNILCKNYEIYYGIKLFKNCWIYFAKLWDLLVHWIY